jgi:hypothetical protein
VSSDEITILGYKIFRALKRQQELPKWLRGEPMNEPMADAAHGATRVITPEEAARLAQVRLELQHLQSHLTLWCPPDQISRIEIALVDLRDRLGIPPPPISFSS